MSNVYKIEKYMKQVRPSELLLVRVLNPAQNEDIGSATPKELIEACGIIPDFFCNACTRTKDHLTLNAIADGMESDYQSWGYVYSLRGTVDSDGTYRSEYAEDPALAPLARFIFKGFDCFVYDYGITVIRDLETHETKIARFD